MAATKRAEVEKSFIFSSALFFLKLQFLKNCSRLGLVLSRLMTLWFEVPKSVLFKRENEASNLTRNCLIISRNRSRNQNRIIVIIEGFE